MRATPAPRTDLETARRARRGLTIYFTVVVALSAAIQAVIISRPDLDGLIAGLMLVPTVASVVARLALKEGFADVSFRFGGRRGGKAIVQAVIFPVVIGLVAYGIGWTTGLVRIDPPPIGALIAVFVGGIVVSLVVVSGEEIGWRGYMLTRLIDSGVPRPVLASGLIWALWHVPLVLAGVYAAGPSPIISAVLLVVGITSFGYMIARMRLETGSIWPAIVLHTAWNSIIIRGFDPATTGSGAMLWVGESGILTTLALLAAAVVYSRGQWEILCEPPRTGALGIALRREGGLLRMTTYVLVGGGWLGGWCWQRVARRLREEGHDAYPATLTGLGERVHLASPEVDLQTHITDVVNLIEFEDLRDVVLLGHSYGGLVVSGAADKIPERISCLVYLDTAPLPDGASLIEKFPPELRKRTEEQVQELGEGWKFAIPPQEELANMASLEGVDEDHLRLLYSRATPQPFGTYTQPLHLKNPAREELPKLGIVCSFSLDQVREMIASGSPLFGELARPEWRFAELPTGHYPMFSRPDDLAKVLLDAPSEKLLRSEARATT